MTLSLEGRRRSLRVDINTETGEFLLAGVSLPENTNSFFEPILLELEEYVNKPQAHTTINFFIEYLNTSSALFLRRIVMLLEDGLGNGKLTVNWHYELDDEDIEEFGADFKSVFKVVEFNLIQIEVNPYT
jgi:hypothetical protein